jgi:hypothetical protein
MEVCQRERSPIFGGGAEDCGASQTRAWDKTKRFARDAVVLSCRRDEYKFFFQHRLVFGGLDSIVYPFSLGITERLRELEPA